VSKLARLLIGRGCAERFLEFTQTAEKIQASWKPYPFNDQRQTQCSAMLEASTRIVSKCGFQILCQAALNHVLNHCKSSIVLGGSIQQVRAPGSDRQSKTCIFRSRRCLNAGHLSASAGGASQPSLASGLWIGQQRTAPSGPESARYSILCSTASYSLV